MPKMTRFSVFVFVFSGIYCINIKGETTEPSSDDWREIIEIRFLNLERELEIQKQANAKLQAEIEHLHEKCQESKSSETRLSKSLSGNENLIVPRTLEDYAPVAFYSYILRDTTHHLQLHQTIIYDIVRLNRGNGYHHDDGVFVVPSTGTYAFVWTLGVSQEGWVTTELAINGQKYGGAFADGDDESIASGTGFVIADVNAGDHVYIRMGHEGDPLLYGGSMTSFSGWKLY